jgi:hypothetical protein
MHSFEAATMVAIKSGIPGICWSLDMMFLPSATRRAIELFLVDLQAVSCN